MSNKESVYSVLKKNISFTTYNKHLEKEIYLKTSNKTSPVIPKYSEEEIHICVTHLEKEQLMQIFSKTKFDKKKLLYNMIIVFVFIFCYFLIHFLILKQNLQFNNISNNFFYKKNKLLLNIEYSQKGKNYFKK